MGITSDVYHFMCEDRATAYIIVTSISEAPFNKKDLLTGGMIYLYLVKLMTF